VVPPFVREWPVARRSVTDDSRQVSQLKKVKIGG
jgi:hypothetical protein